MVLAKDPGARQKYAPAVWDMLQQSYAKIGGIKGSGFASMEDMIARIPFWKLYFEGNTLKVVMMYKDSQGRKGVALGTDGSRKAMRVLSDLLRDTFRVSYGEYSKGALIFILKNVPQTITRQYALSPSEVAKFMDDEIVVPTQEYVDTNLDASDKAVYNRLKTWRQYFYVRMIGGKPFLKIAIGTPHQTIK